MPRLLLLLLWATQGADPRYRLGSFRKERILVAAA